MTSISEENKDIAIKFFKFEIDKKNEKKKLYIDNNNKVNLSFFFEMIKKDRLNYMNTQNSFEIIKCENIKNFFKSINLKTNIILK